MYEVKTKQTDADVIAFLETIEDEQKRKDSYQLIDLMRSITNAEPVMWGTSIIGFGKANYHYASGNSGEWPVIGFSPRKQNLTIYSMTGWVGREEILAKLGKHKTGKGCLYLNRLEQINLDALRELLIRSIKTT